MRFDSAYHNTYPDRAEFFYAKCGCDAFVPANRVNFDPNAPGPQPGIPTYVNYQQLYLNGEAAVGRRLGLFHFPPPGTQEKCNRRIERKNVYRPFLRKHRKKDEDRAKPDDKIE